MTEELKPHQIAQLVNKLRDIATKYHAHGCLRELISREVNAALTQRPAAQATRTTADTLLEIKAASCKDCGASGYTDPGEADSPDGPGRPAVVCGSCLGTGWRDGVHISDQQATPEPVVHKCRHCGVTTIEDEDGVTMQGLPTPERPVMFDPSADVPIPATPEPVGDAWGWAIEDKHGVAQAIRPARKEFFGCVQSTDPFTAEDIAKMDREWSGIAPHHVVTLYTRPAPGVPDAEDLRDRLVAISSAVADSDDRAAQSMLSETLRLLAAQAKGGS